MRRVWRASPLSLKGRSKCRSQGQIEGSVDVAAPCADPGHVISGLRENEGTQGDRLRP